MSIDMNVNASRYNLISWNDFKQLIQANAHSLVNSLNRGVVWLRNDNSRTAKIALTVVAVFTSVVAAYRLFKFCCTKKLSPKVASVSVKVSDLGAPILNKNSTVKPAAAPVVESKVVSPSSLNKKEQFKIIVPEPVVSSVTPPLPAIPPTTPAPIITAPSLSVIEEGVEDPIAPRVGKRVTWEDEVKPSLPLPPVSSTPSPISASQSSTLRIHEEVEENSLDQQYNIDTIAAKSKVEEVAKKDVVILSAPKREVSKAPLPETLEAKIARFEDELFSVKKAKDNNNRELNLIANDAHGKGRRSSIMLNNSDLNSKIHRLQLALDNARKALNNP